jgi:hypothetical protein
MVHQILFNWEDHAWGDNENDQHHRFLALENKHLDKQHVLVETLASLSYFRGDAKWL